MTVTCGGKGRTDPKETLLKVVLLGVGLISVYRIKKALKGVRRDRNDLRAPWGFVFHNFYLRHTDKTNIHTVCFKGLWGQLSQPPLGTGSTIRLLFYYKVLSWGPAKSQATS